MLLAIYLTATAMELAATMRPMISFGCWGDGNGNGSVTISDYFLFVKAFRDSYFGQGLDPAFDFNGDGNVNIIDFFQFRSQYGKTI